MINFTKKEIEYINDLKLKDDILFHVVFNNDQELARQLIEILLNRQLKGNVELLVQSSEKQGVLNKESIFDLKLKNNNTIYVIEVQKNIIGCSAKRIRVINSNATLSNSRGRDYIDICNVEVCMICDFDIIGNKNEYYKVIKSINDIEYNDGANIHFFNINSNKIPNSLLGALLKSFNGVYENYPFINIIKNKIIEIKKDGVNQMMFIESLTKEYAVRKEGILEGKKEGILEGKKEAILKTIPLLKSLNLNKYEIIEKLLVTYDLSKEEINELVCSTYQVN